DALWTGVLTHAMASPDLAALEAALAQESDLEAALRRFATDPGPAPIAERAAAIEDAFGRGSVSAVLAALDASSDAWAVDTAALIRSRSPMSLAITFRQVREGATLDFDACMRLDFRIVSQILKGHDFYEGVRAVLVDKDHAPKWQPARLEDLDSAEIDKHFVAPPEGDLDLTP